MLRRRPRIAQAQEVRMWGPNGTKGGLSARRWLLCPRSLLLTADPAAGGDTGVVGTGQAVSSPNRGSS